MREVICCIEHQTIPIVDTRQPGQVALTKAQVEILSRLRTLPAHAFVWGHNAIKWSQYCGLVQLGDLTLEILPKIHAREAWAGACRQALVRMLYKAGIVRVYKTGAARIDVQRHTLLDIFILDFCDQLNQQLVQGRLRQYITIEENLCVLKGRLLANHQMRRNLTRRERLYCQYDELSEDMLINQVIKFTLQLLLPRTRSESARKAVTHLLMAFEAISDRPVTPETLDFLVMDRISARYRQVIELCRLFISRLNPDLGAGAHESFALMFDMNQLFERWSAAMLKPVAQKLGMKLKEQGPRKYMAYRVDLDKPVFQMRPDICLLDSNQKPILVADAKWKLLEADEARLGIAQADLYQMQAYANRYEVDNLVLIYPRQSRLRDSYSIYLRGIQSAQLTIMTLDISAATTAQAFAEYF